MTELHKVLMRRDHLTWEQAEDRIRECREEALELLDEGEMPLDICEEHFNLEEDYLEDLGIF